MDQALQRVAKVLNDTRLDWRLSHGALLGAVRQGSFIPSDTDIDIAIKDEEIHEPGYRKIAVIQALKDNGFWAAERVKHGKVIAIKALLNGAVINLAYWKKEDDLRSYRQHYYIPDIFFRGRACVKLNGNKYPALAPVKTYLRWLYGDWKVPKKKDFFNPLAKDKVKALQYLIGDNERLIPQTKSLVAKPSDIEYWLLSKRKPKFDEWPDRRADDNSRITGRIIGGDWNTQIRAFDQHPVYNALVARYIQGKSWDDCGYKEYFKRWIAKKKQYRYYTDWEAFKAEYLPRIDRIYKDFSAGKINRQSSIITEIEVVITRTGQVVYTDGKHRLSIAKILKVPEIYVVVNAWHRDFVRGFPKDITAEEIFESGLIGGSS